MVKSLIPVLVALLLLSGAAVYEQIYVRSAFEQLREQAVIMQEKEFSGTATVSDAENVRNRWIKEKEKIHAFVSHNDIKELDMWLIVLTCDMNFRPAFKSCHKPNSSVSFLSLHS